LRTRGGHALLESGDALGERRDRGVGIKSGEADERDLERNARIERVLNADERVAERFECAGGPDRTESSGLIGDSGPIGVGESREVGTDRGEEHIAQLRDERLTQNPRIATTGKRALDGDQGTAGVPLAQRFHQFIDSIIAIGDPASSHDPVEGGECVAG
jgi:hypothetical protein